MKIDNKNGEGIAKVILILAAVVLAFLIVGKFFKGLGGFLEKLGIADSKEEKANKQAVEKSVNVESSKATASAFSPTFYKTGPTGTKIFTVKTAETLAKQLWDSVGGLDTQTGDFAFTDTPNKGIAAIKQCYTKSQVSFLSEKFRAKYKVDLLAWLQDKYDTSAQKEVLTQIFAYVEALPNFKAK